MTVTIPVSDREAEAFRRLTEQGHLTVEQHLAALIREYLAEQAPLVPNLG